jgi:hypothetical protein
MSQPFWFDDDRTEETRTMQGVREIQSIPPIPEMRLNFFEWSIIHDTEKIVRRNSYPNWSFFKFLAEYERAAFGNDGVYQL